MPTTIWINDAADAVLDSAIDCLETEKYLAVKKGKYASEQLIRILWPQLPKPRQSELLKRYPSLKYVVA